MTSHSDIYKAGAARVLARDDLLQSAHDAEHAIGLVRQNDRLAHDTFTEPELFDQALQQQLKGVKESGTWAGRAQYLDYAGAIVQFSELIGRVARGISAPGAHRSRRNRLQLPGSCHSDHQTAGADAVHAQWANIRGYRWTIPRQHRKAFVFARSRLYLLRIQRIK